MKTTLYLVVVIAAFALIQESAAAGLREKRNILEDLKDKLEEFKDKLKEKVDKIKDILKEKLQKLREELDKIDDAVKEEILNKLKKILEEIIDFIKNNGNIEEAKQNLDIKLKKLIDALAEKLQMDKTKLEALTKKLQGICEELLKKAAEEYNSQNKSSDTIAPADAVADSEDVSLDEIEETASSDDVSANTDDVSDKTAASESAEAIATDE